MNSDPRTHTLYGTLKAKAAEIEKQKQINREQRAEFCERHEGVITVIFTLGAFIFGMAAMSALFGV